MRTSSKRREQEEEGGVGRRRKEERGLSRLQAVERRRCTLMGLVMASSRWRCCWTRIQIWMSRHPWYHRWSQVMSGDPVTDS